MNIAVHGSHDIASGQSREVFSVANNPGTYHQCRSFVGRQRKAEDIDSPKPILAARFNVIGIGGRIEQCVAQHGLLVRQYGEDAGVSSHNVMGSVCWALGFPDQARQHLLAGRQLAQRLAYPFLLVQNLWRSAVVLQCCGAITEMVGHLATLLREAEAIPFWHAGGVVLQGWTMTQQREEETGITFMRQGLQAWQATGAEVARPYYLTLLAQAYGMSGQVEEGLRSLDEAFQLVANTGERWWEIEIYRLYGELTLQSSVQSLESQEENQKAKVKSQKLPTPDL